MAKMGSNVRCVAPLSQRDRIRTFYTTALGCQHMSPRDDVDIYIFGENSGLAVYLVPDDQALTPEQHRSIGTWIEIAVDDPDQAVARIREAGGESFEYHDQHHGYFQAPGGQVFRLAT